MEQGNEKSGPAGRRALTFIFLTMLLDVTGLGIIIPVTPELIMELTGEGLSEAALFGGGLLFAYSGMQFLFAPVIGNLSDRFGRRPVLLLSLTFFALDYVLMGLVDEYWTMREPRSYGQEAPSCTVRCDDEHCKRAD